MKKLSILLLFILIFGFANAQDAAVNKEKTRTAADLKSGNSQDVLTSFFQIGFNDLISREHSFSFASSIMAIRAKTDSNIWIDKNYKKVGNFSRNFSFGFTTKLDSNNKFAGNTLNLKYAIINMRDKSVFSFELPNQSEWNKTAAAALNEYVNFEKDSAKNTSQDFNVFNSKNYLAASNYVFPGHEKPTPYSKLPPKYKEILAGQLTKSASFQNYTGDSFQSYVFQAYDMLSKQIGNRPLLTLASNLSSDASGKLFNAIDINLEYLQGLYNLKDFASKFNFSNVEADAKAAFDDSAAVAKRPHRQILSGSVGLNWIVARDKQRKSFVEFKASATDAYILTGLLKDKNEAINKFTFDGTLRLRITNNFWIPMDIKYDPGSHNLFGFVSIKTNFDALGK